MVEQVAGPPPAGKTPAPRRLPRDEFANEIRRIVEPHLLPGDDPRRSDLDARIDQAMSALLRTVLHDPAFQSLEAAWRAVYQFVRRIETGPDLGLWLLDVSRDELALDLDATRDLERSVLHRRIVDEATAHGATRWSLVTCDVTFGPGEADVVLLARLAELGRRAGAPILAAADPALAGAPGFETDPEPAAWSDGPHPAWELLRRSAVARWAGLALPRFLLRVPYGEEGETCDAFPFEELESPPAHAAYLWGRASWACAILLAETFERMGADMRPGVHQDIEGLPLHIHREAGAAYAKPCAESVMTERAANRLLESGLMPLASLKDRDTVRLVRFQSIAHPVAALAGRWSL
jgi:type VI secretion system protein ImpC